MAIQQELQPARPRVPKKEYARSHVGFAWLRVSCSLMVVLSHSFWLPNPVHQVMILDIPLGEYALLSVFAMSGFQIHDSWERDPSWWRFSARRILRIVPPLAVVLALSMLVLGPIFTKLSLGQYFRNGQTWHYMINVVPFWLQGSLPGVFAGNPYKEALNPSMWTLPMELLGYGLLLVLGVAISFGLRRFALPVLLAGLMVVQGIYDVTLGPWDSGGMIGNSPMVYIVKYLIAFVAGAILHTYRHKIVFRARYAVGLIVAWLLIHISFMSDEAAAAMGAPGGSVFKLVTLDKWIMALVVAYGVITLGTHWPKRLERFAPWVFCSYGLYLWGAALQQTLISVGLTNSWVLLAVSLPLAYTFGQLSWRLVETPTQRWRRYLKARQL